MDSAVIAFEGYKIEKIAYNTIDKNLSSDKIESENKIETAIKIGTNESITAGKVTFDINYEDYKNYRKIELTVDGFFDVQEESLEKYGEEEIQKIIAQNGTAIVYPYVRSLLSMITSLDSPDAVLLPTINTSNLLTNKD